MRDLGETEGRGRGARHNHLHHRGRMTGVSLLIEKKKESTVEGESRIKARGSIRNQKEGRSQGSTLSTVRIVANRGWGRDGGRKELFRRKSGGEVANWQEQVGVRPGRD